MNYCMGCGLAYQQGLFHFCSFNRITTRFTPNYRDQLDRIEKLMERIAQAVERKV